MALIKALNDKTPQFGNNCFLAENATIIGDVIMGDDCSIWFNAVVRVVIQNTAVESGSVYAGAPAKKVKTISKELSEGEIERIANSYLKYSSWYK